MRKLFVGLAALATAASPVLAAPKTLHISGQGTIADGRVFSLNATVDANGNVRGKATLINRNFTGDNGKTPYMAHIDISCINQVDGEIYLGGYPTRTNDSNLVDAVFFAVSDDGQRLSSAFFWDNDPNTTGPASACEFNNAGDFPTHEVVRGNIHVN